MQCNPIKHIQIVRIPAANVDASHFTIKYEIDHVPGTIDGWLQADDTVKLTIRDGPALPAATTSPATQP